MNTTENNNLLAEFLGYTQPHPNYPNTSYWYKKDEQPLTLLSFHSDWNWLMQVVYKIESIGYVVNINGIKCSITPILSQEIIISYVIGAKELKLKLVYATLIDFVKWYNENK